MPSILNKTEFEVTAEIFMLSAKSTPKLKVDKKAANSKFRERFLNKIVNNQTNLKVKQDGLGL